MTRLRNIALALLPLVLWFNLPMVTTLYQQQLRYRPNIIIPLCYGIFAVFYMFLGGILYLHFVLQKPFERLYILLGLIQCGAVLVLSFFPSVLFQILSGFYRTFYSDFLLNINILLAVCMVYILLWVSSLHKES